jgi:hypothetical protein
MTLVLNWIKANVFTVIFIAVMVVALVALPIVAGRLNAAVREDVERRLSKYAELESLEKTQVTFEGSNGQSQSASTLVNEKLLNRFSEVTEAKREDAERVLEEAIEHNRQGRGVLLDELFPEPPPARRETLPKKFHERLVAAYEALLAELQVRSAPSVEQVQESLERRRSQFYTIKLQKDLADPLNEKEEEQLREELTEARMGLYAEAADDTNFYGSLDGLYIPQWDQARMPTMAELFEWQWQYWINEDLLKALAEANRRSSSVQTGPVKRVLSIAVLNALPTASGGSSSSGGGGGGGSGFGVGGGSAFGSGGAPGRRGAGGGGGGARGDADAAPTRPVDPAKPVPVDYGYTFTGRVTNPLYDVRHVEMSLIVDTARVPEVLDALARHNFITIYDLRMLPADSFAAAKDGYLYGAAPVSQLILRLETVWLRSWTAPFMPDEVKAALGIPRGAPLEG